MTVINNKYPLSARTNDDFTLSVECPYDITALTLLFKLITGGVETDWSQYIVKTSATSFIISIKADVVAALGEKVGTYDCAVDFGSGSKDFLFGGNITITKGIS